MMSLASQSHKLRFIGILLSTFLLVGIAGETGAEQNDFPVLTLRLENTNAFVGSDNATIDVYLTNYSDTLSGFALRVLLNRPDLIEFKTDIQILNIDTSWQYCDAWENGVCVHWVDTMIVDTIIESGAIDTAGCAISGWEYVTAVSSEGRHDIKVTGLADYLGGDYTFGLIPQPAEILLLRLKARVYGTLPATPDSIAQLIIVDNLSETNFSDPTGNLIGTITEHNICDTAWGLCLEWDGPDCIDWRWADTLVEFADSVAIDTFYHYWVCDSLDADTCAGWADTMCTEWSGETCLSWVDVDEMTAERITTDSMPWTVRDTSVSFYSNGTIQIVEATCLCGDINTDGTVNLGDPAFMINYIFRSGPAPEFPDCADCNGDGGLNMGDAGFLINYIFFSGPSPICNGG